ncbi:ABC transporter substrate-binding protein [Kosmotoga pacifica]|uniref:Sugar ABC transporter substrate-binding protein n=1 Tax=Kosmotoga pacifica TaxID=1330330 RepID=A0A0G2ZDW6_9BACT|nr:sugar ABC transporter substrate-binding protein [Kosmotoga pacifica]AKI97754.1 hypothetical protein IX53_07940 [Kosmotoga pacifica]
MRKVLLLALVMSLLVVALGATKISYMTFSAVPNHEETLKEIAKAFEAQNPGIRVDLIFVPWSDYFLKLSTMFAGGTPPDAFEINYENFVEYAADGLLMPLDGLNESYRFKAAEVFSEKAYNAFSYQGKQYGFPESFSTVVLFYNKELFDEKGVEYPSPDWSWIDEFNAAVKLTDKEKGIWGVYQPIQFWEYYKVIAQNGGAIFNSENEVTVNNIAGVNALKWLIDKPKYGIMPSEEEAAGLSSEDLFVMGKLAMVHTGIWLFNKFREEAPFEWDIEVEPGMSTKATHYFANAVVASAGTPHKEAVWKWLKFLTTDEYSVKIRIEKGWELPAVKDPDLISEFLKSDVAPRNKKAIFDSLEWAIVPPVVKGWSALADVVNKEIDAAKFGMKSPEEALNDLAVLLKSKISE